MSVICCKYPPPRESKTPIASGSRHAQSGPCQERAVHGPRRHAICGRKASRVRKPEYLALRARNILRLWSTGKRHAVDSHHAGIGGAVVFDATHSVQQPGGLGGPPEAIERWWNLWLERRRHRNRWFLFRSPSRSRPLTSDGPNMIYLDQFDSVWGRS